MKTFTKLTMGAAVVALMAGGVALAQPGGRAPAADANNDGTITRAEAQAAATARFARMDANNDGRLTAEDRTAARERRHGEMFTAMDTDRNGSISRAEWDSHHAQMAQNRAGRAAGHDDDGDDANDAHEPGRRGHGRHGMRHSDESEGPGMAMARRADTNNDNAIDRAEFLAAANRRFQRADANNDGTISAAERQSMRDRMRQRMGRRGPGGPAGDMPLPPGDDD